MNKMLDLIRFLGYHASVAFNNAAGLGSLYQIADEPLPFSGVFSSSAWSIFYGWVMRGVARHASLLFDWSSYPHMPTHPSGRGCLGIQSQIGVSK